MEDVEARETRGTGVADPPFFKREIKPHGARDAGLRGGKIAERIAKKRSVYEKARRCSAVFPTVRARIATALDRLGTLLPDAKFSPVIFLIRRNNSGATTMPAGVLVGLETICRAVGSVLSDDSRKCDTCQRTRCRKGKGATKAYLNTTRD